MALYMDAYLDIETTGLSPFTDRITVIGLYLVKGSSNSLVQLVGDDITDESIIKALRGVRNMFTYNGRRFDMPFIHACTGVDLCQMHHHHDLMFDCWDRGLYGGFKAVEQRLGIKRQTKGIDGWQAVRLWHRYAREEDRESLALLLKRIFQT